MQPNWTQMAKMKQGKLRWRKQNINLIWTWKLLYYHWFKPEDLNLISRNFAEQNIFMLNLNKKNGTWTSFLYIKSSFFNFKRNLKLETFDHGTFFYKVHELLLITLQGLGLQCTLWVGGAFLLTQISKANDIVTQYYY